MKLALCVITEGDSKLENLKALIASTEGIFSSIHITANGGETRQSTKALQAWCKKQNIDYSFLKWSDDFSKQRNYNFQKVPKNTDYILWADSDDILVGASYIPQIARIAKEKEYDTVFFTYWYGNKFSGTPSLETFERVELQHLRERLIRPESIIWKKRIHETPVPIDGARYTYSKVPYSEEYPVAWLHLGADRNISKASLDVRMKRNRRLLEKELQDESEQGNTDPRTLLYLMKVLSESEDEEDLTKCIELGYEYLAKSGWDQETSVVYSTYG